MKKTVIVTIIITIIFLVVSFLLYNWNRKLDLIVTYECPFGYIEEGNLCVKEYVETPYISYFCNNGYDLIGNICIREQEYSAKTVSYCPSGYQEIVNGNCRSTDEKLGTYKYYCTSYSKPIVLYNKQCYIELGTDPIYGQVGGVCIHGTITTYGVISPTSYCRYYSVTPALKELECPIGYSKFNNIHINTQWCQSDKQISKEIKYVCNSGDALYYNKCIHTEIINPSFKYNCLKGQLGEDNNCYYKELINKIAIYECPSGYTLSKNKCIRD